VSHPGVRFNALNKPAKPSGRRQGLRSTVGFSRSTLPRFFGSWPLMRRPADAAADFLALGSCQCRLTIFVVVVAVGFVVVVAAGPRRCDGVSSGAFVTSMTGLRAIGSRTYAISNLSALVNVSCEKLSPTVVCSVEALTFGGGVGVPAPIATIAPRPIKQRTASHTVLITANPARSDYARIDYERRTESGA
jgi:hypothetical protein